MQRSTLWPLICFIGASASNLCAQTPPLLAHALQQWSQGEGEVAFTQQTRSFLADGKLKDERIERYDPSLPDSLRWRLVEVGGLPATEEQRRIWETRKNGKPKRKVDKAPSKFLDLEHATKTSETSNSVRFKIAVRPEAERLLDVEQIDVVLTVDKQSGNIAGVGATLREPIPVLLGLARITNLDVDVRMGPGEDDVSEKSDEVRSGSTARIRISKLGHALEYNWSDFRRVAPYTGH